jgi:hypothetical protein
MPDDTPPPPAPAAAPPADLPPAVVRAALIDALARMSDAEVLELWRICSGWGARQPTTTPPDPPR